MTIKELKEKIKDLPDHMDVFLGERETDFAYGLAESAEVVNIDFSEDPDGDTMSDADVFVLLDN